MNANQTTTSFPAVHRGETPQALSLETLELVQQVLTHAIADLRDNATAAAARDAGALEYASWLQRRH